MTRRETIRLESLTPKVQRVRFPARAPICCAYARLTIYMLWSVCRSASHLRHLTASFDSFVGQREWPARRSVTEVDGSSPSRPNVLQRERPRPALGSTGASCPMAWLQSLP